MKERNSMFNICLSFCLFYIDVGCPTGHYMQCFSDSGHKDATGNQHWNDKVNNHTFSSTMRYS